MDIGFDITGIIFLGFLIFGFVSEKKRELAKRTGATRITN